jgi:predicted ATP-dependent serine protease
MGDPGVAKSQLLSFIDRLAPRSKYNTVLDITEQSCDYMSLNNISLNASSKKCKLPACV